MCGCCLFDPGKRGFYRDFTRGTTGECHFGSALPNNNDLSTRAQGKVFTCDDVGDEPLREVMKNIALGQVKPKEEDEELPTPSIQVEATCKDDSKVDEDNVNYESSNEEGDASHSPQDIQGGQVVEDQLSFHDTHITNE